MKYDLKNISKRYGSNCVIDNFTYQFYSGLYLLTGKNGTGKSTLLKIIAKVIFPSNKDYHITDINVAYLCEKPELLNLKVISFLKKISKINDRKLNINSLIKKWCIPNKYINQLSNGNKQKVALLMMYLTESDIFVFDEPTNALDELAVGNFIEVVKESLENDKIVIISTHEKELFKSILYTEIKL